MLYPLKFTPILKSLIWGGEKIINYKSLNSDQKMVGESWELSGVKGDESVVANGELAGKTITELLQEYGSELIGDDNYKKFGNEFPLLIKFIDARDDLSIQVHPDDTLAKERHQSKGKTEMWYVVDADKRAKLRSGFKHKVSKEEYLESVGEDKVCDILQEYEVNAGDLFFLPAGRIHSIGKGCFIAEIQQTSNITYRIYDFNRKDSDGNTRELHTELALDAIDYSVEEDYRTEYNRVAKDIEVELVQCNYFKTSLLELSKSTKLDYSKLNSFVIFICLEGSAKINSTPLAKGETLLLPATTLIADIDTDGGKFLAVNC